jgi:hypothetical protein
MGQSCPRGPVAAALRPGSGSGCHGHRHTAAWGQPLGRWAMAIAKNTKGAIDLAPFAKCMVNF